MEFNQTQLIRRYVDIVLRRKTVIITFMLIGVVCGLAFYLTKPRVYQGVTLLSYQQQRINPNTMSPEVVSRIRDIVGTLTQIVTSRTSLEKIINDLDLYKEARLNLPMEDVVELMREDIIISPSNRGDTFQISYTGNSAESVARVTNTVASKFIEENLKYREERASETSAYTGDELQMAKVMLDKKEAVMRDYKLQYYNEMPDQRASNMSRLIAFQVQYQGKQDSIQDLERTRALIQEQIAGRRQVLAENENLRYAARDNALANEPVESEAARIFRLKTKLEDLQGKYTDKHPDVRRLKKTIAQLEESAPGILSEKGEEGNSEGLSRRQTDEVLFDLQLQLKDVSLSIQNINKEKKQLQELITQYEKWVESAPVREAEWFALTREYGNLKRHYDFLLSQDLQARSVLNLERKQKGSQFKIEDSARIPEKPISPDFKKIMGLAILLGSGIGGALALGLGLLDTSFRHPDELLSSFNLEVICSVPYVALEKEVRKERIITILGSMALLVSVSAIGMAFIYFWKQGRILL